MPASSALSSPPPEPLAMMGPRLALQVITPVVMVVAAAYAVCYILLAPRVVPLARCYAFAADAIFGLFYYPLVVALALRTIWDLHRDVHSRWHGTCDASRMLGVVLVSRMVVHIPFLSLKKQIKEDTSQRPIFLTHHAIVIMVYLSGLLLGRAHFWGALNALCETTNVFLTVIELLTCCGRGTRRRFDTLHKVSSLCFGLAYFFFRLVLFPLLLVWFASDLWHYPSETLQEMSIFELVLYPLATAMIFTLSVIWAVPVARGIWWTLHQLVEEEVKSP